MADYEVSAGNRVQQWERKFFQEYVRDNRFRAYMGTSENNVIVTNFTLTNKSGEIISIPLIGKLTGNGVTGNALLEGAEENLSNYNHDITADVLRNAVLITKKEAKASMYDDLMAARNMLKLWMMEKTRDGIITSLGSINNVPYADATEAQKDAWLVANVSNDASRVIFGDAFNAAGTDHSAELATIASTETLDTTTIDLAAALAKTASPAIHPIRVTEDEDYYVMFANSSSMRDLRNDTAMQNANRDARARNMNNPLFKGGDLVWNSVIIREVPEIPTLGNVGTAGARVSPNYLCGAQAVGIGWAQTSTAIENRSDYGFRNGVGVMEYRGIDKLVFNGQIDHGVVTVYSAATAIGS